MPSQAPVSDTLDDRLSKWRSVFPINSLKAAMTWTRRASSGVMKRAAGERQGQVSACEPPKTPKPRTRHRMFAGCRPDRTDARQVKAPQVDRRRPVRNLAIN
jgi:hypothetical protein